MHLSICIPTYNRAPFLDYLLNNIVTQIIEDNLQRQLEIVISDNASTDNTKSIVDKYRSKFSEIQYTRQKSNLGFDLNLLNVVSQARGEYCWLFGDDDRFEPHAIIKILNYLKQYNGLTGLSINCQGYSFDFSKKVYAFSPLRYNKLYTSADVAYAEIGLYFSYLSGQVVAKKYWDEVINNKNVSNYFDHYVHTYMVAEMLKKHANWLCIGEQLVGWRSDNDVMVIKRTAQNYLKRMRVDYELMQIAADVFGKDSIAYRGILNYVGAIFIRGKLLDIKMAGYTIWQLFPEITKLFAKTLSYYTKILPVFFIPRPMIRAVRLINRKVRSIKQKLHLNPR